MVLSSLRVFGVKTFVTTHVVRLKLFRLKTVRLKGKMRLPCVCFSLQPIYLSSYKFLRFA